MVNMANSTLVNNDDDEEDGYDGKDSNPVYDKEENDGGGDEVMYGDDGQSLVIQKTLLTPKAPKKDNWLRTSVFHATCIVRDCKCHVMVDSRSCENVVSQDGIDKLKLPCEKHPTPYKLSWFKKGNEVIVTSCALVIFYWRLRVQNYATTLGP